MATLTRDFQVAGENISKEIRDIVAINIIQDANITALDNKIDAEVDRIDAEVDRIDAEVAEINTELEGTEKQLVAGPHINIDRTDPNAPVISAIIPASNGSSIPNSGMNIDDIHKIQEYVENNKFLAYSSDNIKFSNVDNIKNSNWDESILNIDASEPLGAIQGVTQLNSDILVSFVELTSSNPNMDTYLVQSNNTWSIYKLSEHLTGLSTQKAWKQPTRVGNTLISVCASHTEYIIYSTDGINWTAKSLTNGYGQPYTTQFFEYSFNGTILGIALSGNTGTSGGQTVHIFNKYIIFNPSNNTVSQNNMPPYGIYTPNISDIKMLAAPDKLYLYSDKGPDYVKETVVSFSGTSATNIVATAENITNSNSNISWDPYKESYWIVLGDRTSTNISDTTILVFIDPFTVCTRVNGVWNYTSISSLLSGLVDHFWRPIVKNNICYGVILTSNYYDKPCLFFNRNGTCTKFDEGYTVEDIIVTQSPTLNSVKEIYIMASNKVWLSTYSVNATTSPTTFIDKTNLFSDGVVKFLTTTPTNNNVSIEPYAVIVTDNGSNYTAYHYDIIGMSGGGWQDQYISLPYGNLKPVPPVASSSGSDGFEIQVYNEYGIFIYSQIYSGSSIFGFDKNFNNLQYVNEYLIGYNNGNGVAFAEFNNNTGNSVVTMRNKAPFEQYKITEFELNVPGHIEHVSANLSHIICVANLVSNTCAVSNDYGKTFYNVVLPFTSTFQKPVYVGKMWFILDTEQGRCAYSKNLTKWFQINDILNEPFTDVKYIEETDVYVVSTTSAKYISQDKGLTFTMLVMPTDDDIQDIFYVNGKYIVFTLDDEVYVSEDNLETWILTVTPAGFKRYALFFNNTWIILQNNYILYSEDAINWTSVESFWIPKYVIDNNVLLVYSATNDAKFIKTTDGTNWTEHTLPAAPTTSYYEPVFCENNIWVTSSSGPNSSFVLVSTDNANTWTKINYTINCNTFKAVNAENGEVYFLSSVLGSGTKNKIFVLNLVTLGMSEITYSTDTTTSVNELQVFDNKCFLTYNNSINIIYYSNNIQSILLENDNGTFTCSPIEKYGNVLTVTSSSDCQTHYYSLNGQAWTSKNINNGPEQWTIFRTPFLV